MGETKYQLTGGQDPPSVVFPVEGSTQLTFPPDLVGIVSAKLVLVNGEA